MKYAKNTTTGIEVWLGNEISPSAYHTIPTEKLGLYQSDSNFRNRVNSGAAMMARTNDGLNDIADPIDGTNYLLDLTILEVKTQKELGIITTQMAKAEAVVDENGLAVASIMVGVGGREVAGGTAFFETYNFDSYVTVDIYSGATKVGSYSEDHAIHNGWWVEPDGVVRVMAMDFFGSLAMNLTMKINGFHGAGAAAEGDKFKANIQWGIKA